MTLPFLSQKRLSPRQSENGTSSNQKSEELQSKNGISSNQKSEELRVRRDQMCLLVLACSIVASHSIFHYLLENKRAGTSHARWITTANGYLRSVIFGARQITSGQKANPTKTALCISSVCVSLSRRSSKDICS